MPVMSSTPTVPVVVAIDLALHGGRLFALARQFDGALGLPFVVHQEAGRIEIIPRSRPLVTGGLSQVIVQGGQTVLLRYIRVVGNQIEPIDVLQEPVFGEPGNGTLRKSTRLN